MRAYGYDVSKWQGATPNLTGKSFLFARASIGLQTDAMYATHVANARKAGALVGAYHFGDNGSSPDDQVRVFLAKAGEVDFYILDHEGGRQMTEANVRRFFDLMHDAGKPIGLYHSYSGYKALGQDWDYVALWAGAEPAGIAWEFWQYSGSPLDEDVFNGTPTELRAFAAALKGSLPDVNVTTTLLPFGGRYVIKAGATPHGVKFDAAGNVIASKTWTADTKDSGADYDATVSLSGVNGNPFLRATDGFFAGYLLSAGQTGLIETPNLAPPDTTPFDQADIDDAVRLAVAGKDAEIARLQASIDTVVDQAIAADRAKAQIKVVYE